MPTLADWDPQHPAIWREEVGGQTISLRHPRYPALAEWDDDQPESLQALFVSYLEKVKATLGLPSLLSDGRFTVPLAWLPLAAGEPQVSPPPASFWVTRYADPVQREGRIDRSVVFLAVESVAPGDGVTPVVLGSRLGIRLVGHVAEGGGLNVRITGAARSMALVDDLIVRSQVAPEFFAYIFSGELQPLIGQVRQAAGLSPAEPVWIEGLRVLHTSFDGTLAEIYATVPQRRDDPSFRAYALTVRGLFDEDNQLHVTAVERFPLVAHAVKPHLFPREPASAQKLLVDARPARSRERLEGFRQQVTLPGLAVGPNGTAPLQDPLGLVKVMQSRLVSRTADETAVERINPAGISHARVNPFAAGSGYQRARADLAQHNQRPLFDTIIAYGLPPGDYFELAVPPVLVRYRAGMSRGPGRDGKIVNAEVDFDPCGCHLAGPLSELGGNAANLNPLQVRFGLADVQRSSSRREPMGLTADQRWSWHEYCHVLLAAKTGVLELAFAHSAGDALAAILGDPQSELAEDPRLRGYTFPWAYIHRRHDRSVYDGWSWCGRYHRQARFDITQLRRRKGYQSEQILSSSLFRLYRSLGGDTVLPGGAPDRQARQSAADYAVYLILRAIQSMPAVPWGAIETPDQLVSALTQADVATWPAQAGPLAGRAGGWAHKVIRWAFEAQGLYATTNPDEVVDAPGRPEPVDLFIDDRRPDAEGPYPRGGYMPVSLHSESASPPLWHASAASIQVVGNQISVQVRNRGDTNAADVTVEVWWADWPVGQPAPPAWNSGQWTSLGSSGPATVLAWPSPATNFTGFASLNQPAQTRRVILAAAGCPADLPNTEPATSLPCALSLTPIIDLVAGDNNLGLLVRELP